jgi:hypothetical protein
LAAAVEAVDFGGSCGAIEIDHIVSWDHTKLGGAY